MSGLPPASASSSSSRTDSERLVQAAFDGSLEKVRTLLKKSSGRGLGGLDLDACLPANTECRLGSSYPLSPLEGGRFFPGTSTLTRIRHRWTAPFLDHIDDHVADDNDNNDHVADARHQTDAAQTDDVSAAAVREDFRPRKNSWLKKYGNLLSPTKSKPASTTSTAASTSPSSNAVWRSTALTAASRQGHTAVVTALLNSGKASVNAPCACCGSAPLFWAAAYKRVDVLRRLLNERDVNVRAANGDGLTASHVAARHGHDKALQEILAHPDADVNQKNRSGCTILHVSIENGYCELAAWLVSTFRSTLDVNAATAATGDTALTLAAARGMMAVVAALLEHPGIDVNKKNKQGECAVHVASRNRKLQVVRLLLTLPQSTAPRQMLREMEELSVSDPNDVHFLRMEVERLHAAWDRRIVQMPEMEEYSINPTVPGLALILNVEDFSAVSEVGGPRLGSHLDVDRLERLFQWLHFKTIVPKNQDGSRKTHFSTRELEQQVSGFSRLRDHGSMSAVVVMSHGATHGRVFASDGGFVDVEAIMGHFTAEAAPALANKPKLFIFQACRGHSRQFGVAPSASSSLHASASAPTVTTDAVAFAPPATVSAWSHMAVAYSSIPNFVSYRDTAKGSVFVECLCNVFARHAHRLDLATLLNLVSREVDLFQTETQEKQTCCIEYRNFWKKLYLLPKSSCHVQDEETLVGHN